MAQKKESSKHEPVIQNKNALREYEILDRLEAGISLLGSEVKAIREGKMNLRDSYIRFKNAELFLVGCHIQQYSHVALDAPEAVRDRKLLVHKKELLKLSDQATKKGLTLVPLKVYFKNGRCKVEVGVGRGKKLHDRREDMKRKEADREIARALGRRR